MMALQQHWFADCLLVLRQSDLYRYNCLCQSKHFVYTHVELTDEVGLHFSLALLLWHTAIPGLELGNGCRFRILGNKIVLCHSFLFWESV